MRLFCLTQGFLGPSIPILCYHQIRPDSGMTPEKFASHLDLIQRMGFETISLARLHRIVRGQEDQRAPAVVITFDDCTLDNWIHAVPELRRRGMRGVFFAITDFLVPGAIRPRADQVALPATVPSAPQAFAQALGGDCAQFMNEAEVRTLVHELDMEVYAHSAAHQACFISRSTVGILADNRHWSHAFLCGQNAAPDTPVPPVGSAYAHGGFGLGWDGQPLSLCAETEREAFCQADFKRCKKRLEAILGQPCPFLCLPWGQFDDVTVKAANDVGFEGVLNLEAAYVGPGTDPQRIGRLAVTDRKTRAWLGMKIFLLAHRRLAGFVSQFRR